MSLSDQTVIDQGDQCLDGGRRQFLYIFDNDEICLLARGGVVGIAAIYGFGVEWWLWKACWVVGTVMVGLFCWVEKVAGGKLVPLVWATSGAQNKDRVTSFPAARRAEVERVFFI